MFRIIRYKLKAYKYNYSIYRILFNRIARTTIFRSIKNAVMHNY
jgi:hypothetical protein